MCFRYALNEVCHIYLKRFPIDAFGVTNQSYDESEDALDIDWKQKKFYSQNRKCVEAKHYLPLTRLSLL